MHYTDRGLAETIDDVGGFNMIYTQLEILLKHDAFELAKNFFTKSG